MRGKAAACWAARPAKSRVERDCRKRIVLLLSRTVVERRDEVQDLDREVYMEYMKPARLRDHDDACGARCKLYRIVPPAAGTSVQNVAEFDDDQEHEQASSLKLRRRNERWGRVEPRF